MAEQPDRAGELRGCTVSETLIIIVLAIGVFAIVLVAGVVLVVLARLRRIIKERFETLENVLGNLQTGQADDKPGEPHAPTPSTPPPT